MTKSKPGRAKHYWEGLEEKKNRIQVGPEALVCVGWIEIVISTFILPSLFFYYADRARPMYLSFSFFNE